MNAPTSPGLRRQLLHLWMINFYSLDASDWTLSVFGTLFSTRDAIPAFKEIIGFGQKVEHKCSITISNAQGPEYDIRAAEKSQASVAFKSRWQMADSAGSYPRDDAAHIKEASFFQSYTSLEKPSETHPPTTCFINDLSISKAKISKSSALLNSTATHCANVWGPATSGKNTQTALHNAPPDLSSSSDPLLLCLPSKKSTSPRDNSKRDRAAQQETRSPKRRQKSQRDTLLGVPQKHQAHSAEDDVEPQILQYLLPSCWDYKYVHTIVHGYEGTDNDVASAKPKHECMKTTMRTGEEEKHSGMTQCLQQASPPPCPHWHDGGRCHHEPKVARPNDHMLKQTFARSLQELSPVLGCGDCICLHQLLDCCRGPWGRQLDKNLKFHKLVAYGIAVNADPSFFTYMPQLPKQE
ncbi:hypothetical protein U0070_014997 [Myodes glareolus]|uniref:Uncharacterized protein n=1 Tax=Myodes glareolus TaxID=447135 RepID=A0AAW0I4W3_MYOGA